MDPIRKKVLGRSIPKRGKAKTLNRTDTFLGRQRKQFPPFLFILTKSLSGDKIWLETHIWHAKRMKMDNMWGYRLV